MSPKLIALQNLTAGVTAVRRQLPLVNLTKDDAIVSSHSLATPYGRAVAYTALYEGASFATSDSTSIFRDGERMNLCFEDKMTFKLKFA